VFVVSSHVTGKRVAALAAREFPQSRLLDHVLTAMPTDPLCWQFLLVQTQGDDLALRRGVLSLAPGLVTASRCGGTRVNAATTAPLQPVQAAGSGAVDWHGEILTPIAELERRKATDCRVAAALRFVRAPWLASIAGGTVFGDLRYDREKAPGFAELPLSASDRCPAFVPGWRPPRGDVLGQF
jgi:inner membrane protein